MVVGIAKLDLFLSENHSLKEKRSLLREILDKTSRKFQVPVVEVGHHDLWQRTEIGFSLVGNDRRVVSSLMEKMIGYIEGLDLARIAERSSDVSDF